jgi:hypothetical protein
VQKKEGASQPKSRRLFLSATHVKYEKRDLESMRPILVECLLEPYSSHFEVPRIYKDPTLVKRKPVLSKIR